MLSGKVVKMGSPKKLFGELKQWKYLVLYVDQRGPMNSGTIGMSCRKSFSSSVAIGCCFSGSSVTFHLSRSGCAFGSKVCDQLPVEEASCPDGLTEFCAR